MKITLGIDPDVSDMAFGLWDDNGPHSVHVTHVVRKRGKREQSQVRMARALQEDLYFPPTPSVIAIEGQQIDARRARSKDLFTLAHTTGIATLWCAQKFPGTQIVVPTPFEWKKSVPKHVMQARLYTELGWNYEIAGSGEGRYARPLNPPSTFSHITPGQWKHVGDALLLAKWAHSHKL